jgi:hypothetical protein
MSASKTDFGHLAPGEMKKEHPVFKFPFEIEDVFYDVTGKHATPKVYGGQRSKDTPPHAFFYLKRFNREAMNSQPVRYQPTGIMPDNTRRRPDGEEPSEEEKNRRSAAIVAAAAGTVAAQKAKKAQEGQMTTQMEAMRQMLEQQQTLILRQNAEAQLHRQQAADMARTGNAPAPPNPAPPNHHVNFANDVFEAAGLAFGEGSFPDVNMIDDDFAEFSSPTNEDGPPASGF